jgi:hypothetical protein
MVKTDRLEGDLRGVDLKKSCSSWNAFIGRMCKDLGATFLNESYGGLRNIWMHPWMWLKKDT